MSRLGDPDPATFTDEVRDLVAKMPPDDMLKMLSHSVGTLNLVVELAHAQLRSLRLPARSRELVALAVAVYAESAFELVKHEPMARDAGVENRVQQLVRARWINSPELSDYDHVLLRFTVEVLRSPTISDGLFDAVRDILSDREIVEVLEMIGCYWTFGRITTVLEVPLTPVPG